MKTMETQTKEKLELKDLAPYLPYKLKLAINTFKDDYEPYVEMKLSEDYHSCNSVQYVISGETIHGSKIKPILRPLSYLTKRIDYNGEKFVPIEKLRDLFVTNLIVSENNVIYLNQTTEAQLSVLAISKIKDKLLEWHFDTEGLIEKDLAIDKNSL